MTEDEKQDALDWLDTAAQPAAGVIEAVHLQELVRAAETRENTALGMLMAQRPHAEIRDFLLTGALPEAGDGG